MVYVIRISADNTAHIVVPRHIAAVVGIGNFCVRNVEEVVKPNNTAYVFGLAVTNNLSRVIDMAHLSRIAVTRIIFARNTADIIIARDFTRIVGVIYGADINSGYAAYAIKGCTTRRSRYITGIVSVPNLIVTALAIADNAANLTTA